MQALILIFSLVCLHAGHTTARLAASTQLIDLPANKSTEYFTLTNTGDAVAYVKMSAKNLGRLGDKNAKARDATPKELITIPNKLILKPNQARKIKVIKRVVPGKEDQFFRIYASTMPAPRKANTEADEDDVGLQLHVGLGTNALVIARPLDIEDKLDTKRDGKQLVVANNGNTTVMLDKIRQCNAGSCHNYSSKLIFPKAKRSIELKDTEGVVNLSKYTATQSEEISIG